MTEQQLTATKALAERFDSSLEHTTVYHSPFGLPGGWISVVMYRPEEGVAPHRCKKVTAVADIAPDGSVYLLAPCV